MQVRASLRDLIDRLIKDIPNIRIGLMAHGDYCDQHTYVIRSHDLSGDAESLKDFAMTVPATGGGDAPEVTFLPVLVHASYVSQWFH